MKAVLYAPIPLSPGKTPGFFVPTFRDTVDASTHGLIRASHSRTHPTDPPLLSCIVRKLGQKNSESLPSLTHPVAVPRKSA